MILMLHMHAYIVDACKLPNNGQKLLQKSGPARAHTHTHAHTHTPTHTHTHIHIIIIHTHLCMHINIYALTYTHS